MPAPASVGGISFTAPDVVVDLTESDEEEGLQQQYESRQDGRSLRPAFIPDVTPSNHGLILPGTLWLASGLHELHGSNSIRYEPLPHKFERGSSAGSRVAESAGFYKTRGYSKQLHAIGDQHGPSRRFRGQRISNSSVRAQGLDMPNPAKRRKTEGVPNFRPQVYPNYAPILPPQNHISISKLGVRPILAKETVKTRHANNLEGQRAETQAFPKKKLLYPTPPAAQRIAIDEKRLHDVAKNRVLKHVRSAIQKYQNGMPRNEQDYVARDVVRKLLSDPRLFENFEKNNWTKEYDKKLSIAAQYYVDSNITVAPTGQRAEFREYDKTNSDSDETTISGNAILSEQQHWADRGHVASMRGQSSSAYSTEDESVFERFPASNRILTVPTHTQRRPHYSSSPTTSFTTDVAEGKHISLVKGGAGIKGSQEAVCKAGVVWTDEEQNLLAILIKTQRQLENPGQFDGGAFWDLITSQLADHGIYRSVASVRSHWNSKGRDKFKFEERTHPQTRQRAPRQKAISGGKDVEVTHRMARRSRLGDTTTTSPTPELAFSSQHLEPAETPSCDRTVACQVPSDACALHVSNHTPALDADISKIAVIREIQSLRLAGLDPKMERPYLSAVDREDVRRGFELMLDGRDQMPLMEDLRQLLESVLHVNFSPEEMEFVCGIIRAVKGGDRVSSVDVSRQIMALMKHQETNIDRICSLVKAMIKQPGKEIARSLVNIRSEGAIRAFLEDAVAGTLSSTPHFLGLGSTSPTRQVPAKPSISSLLREREVWGMAPSRVGRCKQPFGVEISNLLEDSIVRQSEWTDCCGDISAVSWISDKAFICGATAHSDFHNMQYNKPGNLLVGSTTLGTLKSIPDHRIVRPIVGREENAENALESMRQTQDPWLYTSVVSTAHSEVSGYTFTASFDETIKVWKVSDDGSSMELCGTWEHDGKVNFVVTSEHHERVATASDVSSGAIRVYNLDESSITGSPYDTYDCDRALAQAQEPRRTEMWAYFPATIAWGISPSVEMFLLVGYSPRSLTPHESDIPEDKRNSGELCLWNVENGQRVLITSAKSQNVFEVIWHPTQPIFLAATSPAGTYEPDIRTQIRLFGQTEGGVFTHIKTLDCIASDINELTVMPNSNFQCYVTASCTDGNTYVWDTAQGDRAIHVLGHGDSLDNPIHDIPREDADTGVKFAAWGKTADRFYTGSSDGKVKAWDIHAPRGETFVRTVLSLSGGVSAGAFSGDFSKLLIGDATGKVHLLAINDEEVEADDRASSERAVQNPSSVQESQRFAAKLPSKAAKKVPKVIIPHKEPAPPVGFEFGIEVEQSAADMARAYLEEGQITLLKNRMIGAVQGPNYSETLFYRYDAHEDNDGTLPLLPEWQARQQWPFRGQITNLTLARLPVLTSSSFADHQKNISLDFDFSRLSMETQAELERDRVEYTFDGLFDPEPTPRIKIFKHNGSILRNIINSL